METIEVLARDGRVLRSLCTCALCDRLVPLADIDVFEGPGQSVPACLECLAEFASWCEGRSAEESTYESFDDGWSSYDEAAQTDEGDELERRAAVGQ